jgi:hypothetical protein
LAKIYGQHNGEPADSDCAKNIFYMVMIELNLMLPLQAAKKVQNILTILMNFCPFSSENIDL